MTDNDPYVPDEDEEVESDPPSGTGGGGTPPSDQPGGTGGGGTAPVGSDQPGGTGGGG